MIKKKILTFSALLLFAAFSIQETRAQVFLELTPQGFKREVILLSGTPDIRFTRNLYYGLRGDLDVINLQNFLRDNGYLNISFSNGNFLSLTLRAVRLYQQRAGIPATGFVGPITRDRINRQIALQRQLEAAQAALRVTKPQETQPVILPTPPSPPMAPTPPAPPPAPAVPPAPPVSPPPFPPEAPPQSGYRINPKPGYALDLIARDIQALINQQRAQAGLQQLAWDDALAAVAQEHSADQAADNTAITDPAILCNYPIIRHEGIRGGYSLSDRYAAAGISYRYGGENIVMFSTGKDFIYQYSGSQPNCPTVRPFSPGEGTREERLSLYYGILQEALNAVRGLPPVNWINKSWLASDEIEGQAVELWMASPGHRANILRPEFNFGGIAVVPVNDYFIITHNFVGRR